MTLLLASFITSVKHLESASSVWICGELCSFSKRLSQLACDWQLAEIEECSFPVRFNTSLQNTTMAGIAGIPKAYVHLFYTVYG